MRITYYYGWNIVGASFLIQALAIGIIFYGFGTLMVPLAKEFALSRAQMQMCYSALMLLSGLLSPMVAILMERLSIRWTIAFGGLLFCLGYTAIAASNSYIVVIGSYAGLLSIAVTTLGNMPTGALIAQWFVRRRGLAISISLVGMSFGGFAFPPLVAVLVTHYGWRMAFALLGVGAFLSTLLFVVFVIRDRPSDAEKAVENPGSGETRTGNSQNEPRLWSVRELLTTRKFWIFSLLIAGSQATLSGVLMNLVPFATDQGITLTQASLLISTMSVSAFLSKIGIGIIIDRVDYRIVFASVLVSSLVVQLLLISSSGSYAVMLLAAIPLGFGTAGYMIVWGVMVAREFGALSFGRAMGLMKTIMVPLTISTPSIAGWIYDRTGSYQLAFVSFAICLLVMLGILAAYMMKGRMPPSCPAQH